VRTRPKDLDLVYVNANYWDHSQDEAYGSAGLKHGTNVLCVGANVDPWFRRMIRRVASDQHTPAYVRERIANYSSRVLTRSIWGHGDELRIAIRRPYK
jgi:hypothetical protein